MRIAHFIMGRCNSDSANGIDKTVYYLSRAQARLGHEVAVFSLTAKPGLPIEGVSVKTYAPKRPPNLGLSARWYELIVGRWPWNYPAELLKDLKYWAPDIVHFHFVYVPQNVVLAHQLRRSGVDYCVTIHGGLVPKATERNRFLKRVFQLVAERRYLNRAKFIHAVSELDAEGLEQYGVVNRVVIAPNGIDRDSLRGTGQTDVLRKEFSALFDKRIFLFIGRLDPVQKGLDILLRAFAAARLQTAALVLVGPSWRGGKDAMVLLAEELGIAERVLFLGPAFGERKVDYLLGSDVFVHPSRWEGFSFSVLEAGACAKPLLVAPSADPGERFSQRGAAVLVQLDVESVTRGIDRLAKMPQGELMEMGRQGAALVAEQFGWEPIAEQLVAAYQIRNPAQPN